jgi:multidrug efflux pump subunit AcrB
MSVCQPGSYSLSLGDNQTVGAADGEMLISLSPHRRRSTQEITHALRRAIAAELPELTVFFQPADIVTQILNFGVPSPIDLRVTGVNREATLTAARGLLAELRGIPGVVDARLHQQLAAPALLFSIDRTRAAEVGLTERDVANNLLLVVGSSAQVAPSWFVDPRNNINYAVVTQTPEHQIDSLDALRTLTLSTARGPQLLADLSRIERRATPVFITHTDLQPTFNVRADVAHRELGGVAAELDPLMQKWRKSLPPGAAITLRGQAESLKSAFRDLAIGLIAAALLVYAIMVINFQSWLDPFIIITALPGAAVGIVLGLFVTGTTFSIPSLMGAVMSVGVATANSILVVSFARDRVSAGMTPIAAALEAGRVRLRPVLMTALAMGLGMLPMSLGLAEGGEQNAALGRAVLGGLFGSTAATLFIVPVIYSLLGRPPRRESDPALIDQAIGGSS